VPVRVEAPAGELGVVRERLAEVVDLAVLRDTPDELVTLSVFLQEDVTGLRHVDDVVRMLQPRGID
jgi:hypothetical protein